MKLDSTVSAVVTGGASGLGAATARALAAKGVKVAIFDLQEEKGTALAAELGGRNIRVVCLGPHAISDAPQAGSYTAELFQPKASAMGRVDWMAR